MAEATYTEFVAFTLKPGGGGGAKMLVGLFQIDDGETITTDFRDIIAVFFNTLANVAAAWHFASCASHPAAGVITTSVGAIGDYADDAGMNFYVMIIGIQ